MQTAIKRKQPGPHYRSLSLLASTLLLALGLEGCAPLPKTVVPSTSALPGNAAPTNKQIPENTASPVIDQQALELLKKMSTTLATAKSFSYKTRTYGSIPGPNGQLLTLQGKTDVALERPDKIRVLVNGDLPSHKIIYDGSRIFAYDPQHNMYATVEQKGGIEAAIEFLENKVGMQFPASDFLMANPYPSMTRNLESGFLAGIPEVDGHKTDHLAFTGPSTDWEIWIDHDQQALPRRFAITFKQAPNLPRFLIEFSDWKLNPVLPASEFNFKPPQGSRQVDFPAELPGESR